MNSIWEKSVERVHFPPLREGKNTDVLIIGGGIAGILCAYMLNAAGVDCMLVEAKNIAGGVTGNTTAKITFAHGLLYDKLIRRYGKERAGLYLQAQRGACEKYAELCRDISCDYEIKDSFVYSLTSEKRIMREVDALNSLGVGAEFVDKLPLPIRPRGAVRVKNQAQFNPLKFIFGISKGLPIYEKTKVLELKNGEAVTEHGSIRYKKLIVATHFPILNKHGSYFLKLYQHRSYV